MVKAEKRNLETLNKPFHYWVKDLAVNFDSEKRATSPLHLGARLKELRLKRSLSQTELAKLVGVTPSTISQVEGTLIYPSLPALIKMAETLSVELTYFFQGEETVRNQVIFSGSEASDIPLSNLPKELITDKLVTPIDAEFGAKPYLIEIPPEKKVPSHFFIHKGEEIGYLFSGELKLNLARSVHTVKTCDLIYLTSEMPSQWENTGKMPAKLLWIKLK